MGRAGAAGQSPRPETPGEAIFVRGLTSPSLLPLAVCAILLPSVVRAQSLIPDEPTCRGCTITMAEIVTLGDDPRAHMPGVPRSVVQDGTGRYWITYTSTLPLVYRSDGRLIRELGPEGDGPGEFRRPVSVEPLPGDSVLVRDQGRGAVFVLRSDLTVVRTVAVRESLGPQVVLEWPDIVFFKGRGRVDPSVVPAVYINAAFKLASLGTEQLRVVNSIGEGWGGGEVAVAGPFAVWTWEYNPYRLERWTAGGKRTHLIERQPPWFPDSAVPMAPVHRGQRPPAHLQAAQQDEAGRLWVFANVPVKVWPEGDAVHPGNAMDEYYRTRVEVIDPEAGRVIASTMLDAWIVSALPGQRAAIYGTNEMGAPFVRIVQLRLVQ